MKTTNTRIALASSAASLLAAIALHAQTAPPSTKPPAPNSFSAFPGGATATPDSGLATKGLLYQYTTSDAVNTVASSPDGMLIAIASGSSAVQILEGATGKAILSLKVVAADEETLLAETKRTPSFEVKALAFSPDGGVLAVGTSVGQVKLFDAKTGKQTVSLDDAKAKAEDRNTPGRLKQISRAIGSVASLSFSPDGKQLAVSGETIDREPFDLNANERLSRAVSGPGRLKIYDANNGTLLHDLDGHSHTEGIAFSSDGNLLASAGRWEDAGASGTGVILWNAQKGDKVRVIETDANGGTRDVAFSPDGRRLVISTQQFNKETDKGSGTVILADTGTGVVEWQTKVSKSAKAAFTGDGKYVVALSDGQVVRFYDSDSGVRLFKIQAAEFPQGGRWVEFSIPSQGEKLVLAGVDKEGHGNVTTWSLKTLGDPANKALFAPGAGITYSGRFSATETSVAREPSPVGNVRPATKELPPVDPASTPTGILELPPGSADATPPPVALAPSPAGIQGIGGPPLPPPALTPPATAGAPFPPTPTAAPVPPLPAPALTPPAKPGAPLTAPPTAVPAPTRAGNTGLRPGSRVAWESKPAPNTPRSAQISPYVAVAPAPGAPPAVGIPGMRTAPAAAAASVPGGMSRPEDGYSPATVRVAPAVRTGRDIIRETKLKVLQKHLEETLNESFRLERAALSDEPDERVKTEAKAKAMKDFAGKLEAEIQSLSSQAPPVGARVLTDPADPGQEGMYVREWKVRPNFFQKGLPALDFLKWKGVTFGEGASATYSPGKGLIVKNTPEQLQLVENLVETLLSPTSTTENGVSETANSLDILREYDRARKAAPKAENNPTTGGPIIKTPSAANRAPHTEAPYSPAQATGQPNAPQNGRDTVNAWCPASSHSEKEWLNVYFENPVEIAEVRIHETYATGALARVSTILFDPKTNPKPEISFKLWEGTESLTQIPSVRVISPPAGASIKANGIQLELNTARINNWQEIDAVELVGRDGSRQWAKNADASSYWGAGTIPASAGYLNQLEQWAYSAPSNKAPAVEKFSSANTFGSMWSTPVRQKPKGAYNIPVQSRPLLKWTAPEKPKPADVIRGQSGTTPSQNDFESVPKPEPRVLEEPVILPRTR